jgi:lysophospholipase L1-like esterase
MTRLLWLLVLCCIVSCEKTAMTYSEGNFRFLALGDSYTIGESVDAKHRWPVLLAQKLRARGVAVGEVKIVATTGWTTDELAAEIDQEKPAGPFDLVSLLIGVNNQYRGRSAESFRPEFSALLQRAIQFAGGDTRRVFVVSIPDWGVMPFAKDRDQKRIAVEIDEFNSVCLQEAEKAGVLFIDITNISRAATTQPALVAEDGLHPSAVQYAEWAAKIDDALKSR